MSDDFTCGCLYKCNTCIALDKRGIDKSLYYQSDEDERLSVSEIFQPDKPETT